MTRFVPKKSTDMHGVVSILIGFQRNPYRDHGRTLPSNPGPSARRPSEERQEWLLKTPRPVTEIGVAQNA